MGADVVPPCRDRYDPADRVAFRYILNEEISSGELDSVRLLFCLLRSDTFAGIDDSLPGPSGLYWRRAYSIILRRDSSVSSAFEAPDRNGTLQRHGGIRSCYRTTHRRLADGQLRMALRLLHQHYSRSTANRSSLVHDETTTDESQSAKER